MSGIILVVYILAGVLPALFLMRYIYLKDKIEKEPLPMLMKLCLSGIYAAFLALLLEMLGGELLANMQFSSRTYFVIADAVMIGISEELSKFFFLYRRTWRSPHFNYRYDGVVYAVFVSLGFAAFENVMYLLQYGLSIAVSRGLLAVPAHMAFGVFMGSFYGSAKIYDVYGKEGKAFLYNFFGVFVAAALHAFYDACAMLDNDTAMMLFIGFVIVMYIVVIHKVRHESRTDRPI